MTTKSEGKCVVIVHEHDDGDVSISVTDEGIAWLEIMPSKDAQLLRDALCDELGYPSTPVRK